MQRIASPTLGSFRRACVEGFFHFWSLRWVQVITAVITFAVAIVKARQGDNWLVEVIAAIVVPLITTLVAVAYSPWHAWQNVTSTLQALQQQNGITVAQHAQSASDLAIAEVRLARQEALLEKLTAELAESQSAANKLQQELEEERRATVSNAPNLIAEWNPPPRDTSGRLMGLPSIFKLINRSSVVARSVKMRPLSMPGVGNSYSFKPIGDIPSNDCRSVAIEDEEYETGEEANPVSSYTPNWNDVHKSWQLVRHKDRNFRLVFLVEFGSPSTTRHFEVEITPTGDPWTGEPFVSSPVRIASCVE